MPTPPDSLRVFELYSGLGGCAAALAQASWREQAQVVAAADQNPYARAAYTLNFPHPVLKFNLAKVRVQELATIEANLWWLSPPCQPYTRRGHRRDDEDPRARSLLHLMDILEQLGPAAPTSLALENVPGFAESRCHRRLRKTLDKLGFLVQEGQLCPSELGGATRRRRFFLVASRQGRPLPFPRPTAEIPGSPTPPLSAHVDPSMDDLEDLRPSEKILQAYSEALSVVNREDPQALTACFTAAYGRSPVRSGSYLSTPSGLRRFSPREILNFLGFPPGYQLPPIPRDLPWRKAYQLVGNSLSVPCVTLALSRLRLLPAEEEQPSAES
ncbi:MAG: DNA cytosine methyltransferase [Acidobacteriota bacterium]